MVFFFWNDGGSVLVHELIRVFETNPTKINKETKKAPTPKLSKCTTAVDYSTEVAVFTHVIVLSRATVWLCMNFR